MVSLLLVLKGHVNILIRHLSLFANGEDCCRACHYPLLPNYCRPLQFSYSTLYIDINMATSAMKSCKQADLKEEFLVYLDAPIRENEFTLGTLSQIKQTILDNSNIISDSFCSSLSQFVIEPTFPYP